MNMLALELNDAGMLGMSAQTPHLQLFGPGYALYEDGRFLYGNEAFERARLKPRHLCNHFWRDLDTQPLGRPFPGKVTSADLVHGQLTHLAPQLKGGPLVLVLPDGLGSEKLALLLGVMQAGDLHPAGMTTSALAAAVHTADHLQPGPVHYLDLSLHRPVATRMRASTQQGKLRLEKAQTRILQAPGYKHLLDIWIQATARRFVHETRFDPLHAAQSEQALFSQLPHWLEQLNREDRLEAVLQSGGKPYHVVLHRTLFVEAARESYTAILDRSGLVGKNGSMLVSQRLARLPGFLKQAREKGLVFTVLPEEAAPAGALAMGLDSMKPNQVIEAVEVQVSGRPAPKRKPVLQKPRPAPTHLLHQGLAHGITSSPFLIGSLQKSEKAGLHLPGLDTNCAITRETGRVLLDPRDTPCLHNGQKVGAPVLLAAGDRVVLNGETEIQLIAVV